MKRKFGMILAALGLLLVLLSIGSCDLVGIFWPVRYVVGSYQIILTSDDASRWREATVLSDTTSLEHVAYGNGVVVAIDETGASWHSENGRRWKSGGTLGGLPKDVAAGDGMFVAAGHGIWYSSDGIEWTAASGVALEFPIEGIAHGDGAFVAVGQSTWTSPDGITWTDQSGGGGNCVAFNSSGRVVAGFGNGTFSYSDDNGETWTNSDFSSYAEIEAIAFGDERFVAVAFGASLTYYSSDGVDWYLGGGIPGEDLGCNDVSYGGGRFVAVGGNGIWVSDDGISWEQTSEGDQQIGFSATYVPE